MLVLTRKQDEGLVLDGRIRIKVLRIRGGSIRLGIEAPRDVPIRRGELNAHPTLAGTRTGGGGAAEVQGML